MKSKNFLILCTFHCTLGIFCIALKESSGETVPENVDPHVEYDCIEWSNRAVGRSQLLGRRWPKSGVVFFYPPSNYSNKSQCYIKKAVEVVNRYSCIPLYLFEISEDCAGSTETIQCVSNSTSGLSFDVKQKMSAKGIDFNALEDYIVVQSAVVKCNSVIGRLGGRQIMNLHNEVCFFTRLGSPIHEILHALGYFHEHARLDRDNYITINTSNIPTAALKNFNILNSDISLDFGPYDLKSIMHYPLRAAAQDPRFDTIIVKEKYRHPYDSVLIGSRRELTLSDKIKIRAVTGCKGSTYEDHLKAIKKDDGARGRLVSSSSRSSLSLSLTSLDYSDC